MKDGDIPAPVFHALMAIGDKADEAKAEAAAARAEIGAARTEIDSVHTAVRELAASGRREMLKQIGAIVIAALGVISTVLATRAAAPTPPPAAASTAIRP